MRQKNSNCQLAKTQALFFIPEKAGIQKKCVPEKKPELKFWKRLALLDSRLLRNDGVVNKVVSISNSGKKIKKIS
jgi:hypothetical protein